MSGDYMEITSGLEVDFDTEFMSVDAVWLVHDKLPAIEITRYLSPEDLDQLRLMKIRQYEEACELAESMHQAGLEDAADARREYLRERREDMRQFAKQCQQEAMSAAERQRGVRL